MAEEQYTSRRNGNEKTLFDYMGAEVDVNLKMGTPGEHLLSKSREYMKIATLQRLDEGNASQLFQYGPEPGDVDFRKALADFLTQEYMDPVEVDDLIVTTGASQSLVMLASLFFSAGDLVFVEDPSYFAALRTLQHDLGLKCIPSPMDEEGIIPDALEKSIEANMSSRPAVGSLHPFWAMVYLIPTFHNPTGVCLSPERCKRIVEIARKYNLLVVCDDVYNLLPFSQDKENSIRKKRLFAYDNLRSQDSVGNVVSNASFSKLFGPGLRLGWLEAPPNVRQRILTCGLLMSGGGLNHFTSGLMTTVITQGLLHQHVKESRLIYKNQCDAVCSTLREKLPLATFIEPQGGYFLWIKLPDPLKAADLLRRCEQELKLTFFTGDVASITSQFKDHVRISFAYYEADVLKVAITKMADLISSMLKD